LGSGWGFRESRFSNYMRLLRLPEPVTQYLKEGKLGFSEARVLLTLLDPEMIPKIADEAVRKHLSVEQLEDLVFNTNVRCKKRTCRKRRAGWIRMSGKCRWSSSERWACGCGSAIARQR